MQVERYEGNLVFRTDYMFVRFMGGFAAAGGLLLLSAGEVTSGPGALVAASVVVIGALIALTRFQHVVIVNPQKKEVAAQRTSLSRSWVERISGSAVASVSVDEDQQDEGPTTYSVHLNLKNGMRQEIVSGLPARPYLLPHEIEEAIGIRSAEE